MFDSSVALWLEAEKQDKNILNFTGEVHVENCDIYCVEVERMLIV